MSCHYHGLMRDRAYQATGVYQPDAEQCPNPASHYVCVDADAEEFGTSYRNVCAAHESVVRVLTGWRWSRPKTVTA